MPRTLIAAVCLGASILGGCTTVRNALTVRQASLSAILVEIQCEMSDAVSFFVASNPANNNWIWDWSAKFIVTVDVQKDSNATLSTFTLTLPKTETVTIGLDARHAVTDSNKRTFTFKLDLATVESYPCDTDQENLADHGEALVISEGDALGFYKVVDQLSAARAIIHADRMSEPEGLGYRREFVFVDGGNIKPGFSQLPLIIVGVGVGATRTDKNSIEVAFAKKPPPPQPLQVVIVEGGEAPRAAPRRPASGSQRLLDESQNFILRSLRDSDD